MRIVYGTSGVGRIASSVATIGVFDGVHKGHQALMARVVGLAREHDATPAVVTFDRHPLEIIAPGSQPRLITTLSQRAEVMERSGIELLLVLSFDDTLRRMTADEFVRRYIVDALRSVHVVVGANFRFGYRHAGTVDTLRRLGRRHRFTVTVFELLGDEHPLSSSLIRRQIENGEVEAVAEELGRPFRLEGIVERGAGRGRTLGIPTANLRVAPKLILPKTGVYAGWLGHAGRSHPAAINVGYNPTFEDRSEPIVEAHVLGGFDEDLYGQTVSLEFTHRLRDELRYPDADALMAQVRSDIERAHELLGA